MQIQKEDGLYRHIRFGDGNSSFYHWNITTWPGFLCFSGDMGCYVFSRTEDMFTFFGDEFASERAINPHYWAEKLQAVDSSGGHKDFEEFSSDMFKDAIKQEFDQWVEGNELEPEHEAVTQLWNAIEDEVLLYNEGEVRAMDAAMAFEYDCDDLGTFTFQDFWEHNCKDYTFHYIWALYAIVWSIREYNNAKLDESEGRNR